MIYGGVTDEIQISSYSLSGKFNPLSAKKFRWLRLLIPSCIQMYHSLFFLPQRPPCLCGSLNSTLDCKEFNRVEFYSDSAEDLFKKLSSVRGELLPTAPERRERGEKKEE